MADDKRKRGASDRNMVAGNEPYEVDYIARKFGVTADQVKAAIKKVGNRRSDVEAELQKLK
jgi:hypothetical protein